MLKKKLCNECRFYSGRCAPKRPPGAVRVPNQCLHAQHSLNHLQYFYQPTANQSLEGGAETKRPRENSLISAISQIQN